MGAFASQLHKGSPYSCLEFVAPPNSRVKKNNQFNEEYSIEATLGEGGFGVVKTCTKRRTGKSFAVKTVRWNPISVEDTKHEADIMRGLNHRNIIKFHEVYYENWDVHIVMDRYLGGDVLGGTEKLLSEKGSLKCEEVVCAVQQMSASIHYLHCHDIVHRDVKGDNYLFDGPSLIHPQCRLVLTDFGSACFAKPDKRLHDQVGTKLYWAPEFHDGDYGRKVDIWALGIIVYTLLTGRFPFRDENDVKMKPVHISSNFTQPCTEFIKLLLSKDEASRPNTEEIVNHEWIAPACMSEPNLNKAKIHLQASEAVKPITAKNFKEASLSELLMESYCFVCLPLVQMRGG